MCIVLVLSSYVPRPSAVSAALCAYVSALACSTTLTSGNNFWIALAPRTASFSIRVCSLVSGCAPCSLTTRLSESFLPFSNIEVTSSTVAPSVGTLPKVSPLRASSCCCSSSVRATSSSTPSWVATSGSVWVVPCATSSPTVASGCTGTSPAVCF